MSTKKLLDELEERLIGHINDFRVVSANIENPYSYNHYDDRKTSDCHKGRISELIAVIGIIKSVLGCPASEVKFDMDGPVRPGFD